MLRVEASPYYTKFISPAVHFVEEVLFDEVVLEAQGVQVVFYDYLDTTVALLDPELTTVEIS